MVKRYDIHVTAADDLDVIVDQQGRWVSYNDYCVLRDDNAKLKKALRRQKNQKQTL